MYDPDDYRPVKCATCASVMSEADNGIMCSQDGCPVKLCGECFLACEGGCAKVFCLNHLRACDSCRKEEE